MSSSILQILAKGTAERFLRFRLARSRIAMRRTFSTVKRSCCPYTVAAEQKARKTYDNILRLSDDPDVNNVIRFLREREIVHFQRFGEAKRTRWNWTSKSC